MNGYVGVLGCNSLKCVFKLFFLLYQSLKECLGYLAWIRLQQ